MEVDNKFKGLVTKKFNEFFLVEINQDQYFKNNKKFLCKIKKSINYKNQLVFVGDEVIIYQIDFQSKQAIIVIGIKI